MEYLFTLNYRLATQDENLDDIVERLGAGGCDDALPGIGQPGRIALEFTRDGASAAAALVSALTDVKRLLPGATLTEAAPDFAGLSDIAEAVGMTRQNLRKLMLKHAASFPAPFHEGSMALWHLADVLVWLKAKGGYRISEPLLEVAETARQINLAQAARSAVPALQQEMASLLA